MRRVAGHEAGQQPGHQGHRGAGQEEVPEAVVLPVGNGTLLLGLYQGFVRLEEAGLAEGMPRLVGVQAAACVTQVADGMEVKLLEGNKK